MADNKNALAELAEELAVDARLLHASARSAYCEMYDRVNKARRIVEELSRVGFNERGQPRDEWMACEAVENCRRIAEEGGES